MKDAIDGEKLAGATTFCKLIGCNVRVIFRDTNGDRDSTCWIGELVRDEPDFIELRSNEGKPSFVNKRFIIAISEMRIVGW
jgi:hypothetical protein